MITQTHFFCTNKEKKNSLSRRDKAKKPHVGLKAKGFGRTSQITWAKNNSSSPDNDSLNEFEDWYRLALKRDSHPSFNDDIQLPGFWLKRPSEYLIKSYVLRMFERRCLRELNDLLIQLLGNDYQKEHIDQLLTSYVNEVSADPNKINELRTELLLLEKNVAELYEKKLRIYGEPRTTKDFESFDNFEGPSLDEVYDVVEDLLLLNVFSEERFFEENRPQLIIEVIILELIKKGDLPYPYSKTTQLPYNSVGFLANAANRYKKILANKAEKITKLEALFFLCVSDTLGFLIAENWTTQKINTTLSVDVSTDLKRYQPLLLLNMPFESSKMFETYENKKNLLICLYELLKYGFFLTDGFHKAGPDEKKERNQTSFNIEKTPQLCKPSLEMEQEKQKKAFSDQITLWCQFVFIVLPVFITEVGRVFLYPPRAYAVSTPISYPTTVIDTRILAPLAELAELAEHKSIPNNRSAVFGAFGVNTRPNRHNMSVNALAIPSFQKFKQELNHRLSQNKISLLNKSSPKLLCFPAYQSKKTTEVNHLQNVKNVGSVAHNKLLTLRSILNNLNRVAGYYVSFEKYLETLVSGDISVPTLFALLDEEELKTAMKTFHNKRENRKFPNLGLMGGTERGPVFPTKNSAHVMDKTLITHFFPEKNIDQDTLLTPEQTQALQLMTEFLKSFNYNTEELSNKAILKEFLKLRDSFVVSIPEELHALEGLLKYVYSGDSTDYDACCGQATTNKPKDVNSKRRIEAIRNVAQTIKMSDSLFSLEDLTQLENLLQKESPVVTYSLMLDLGNGSLRMVHKTDFEKKATKEQLKNQSPFMSSEYLAFPSSKNDAPTIDKKVNLGLKIFEVNIFEMPKDFFSKKEARMKEFNQSRDESFFLTTSFISLKNSDPWELVYRIAFMFFTTLFIPLFLSAYNSQLTSENIENPMTSENPKTFYNDESN